jgi:putative PD-(D/E)XK family protein DUF4420
VEQVSLEGLVALAEDIPPARAGVWTVSEICAGQLYLTRSEDGSPALFLEGAKESFGNLPQIDAIRHSDDVTVVPGGQKLKALRIVANKGASGGRVIAHIAYEIAWRLAQVPKPGNEDLINDVRWLLALFGERSIPLGQERQKGLVGECLFLRMLLRRAIERKIPAMAVLSCWAGADQAKRDFYARKIAVEAKATSSVTRLHHISSLDQLFPQEPDEEVYLFSVGIRQDPTAPRKLTHFIGDVEALLVDRSGKPNSEAVESFRDQLARVGFNWADCELYERDAGFLAPHLPAAVFRLRDLRTLSLTDFVDQKLPDTVRSVSYSLEVVGSPMTDGELAELCDRLVGASG